MMKNSGAGAFVVPPDQVECLRSANSGSIPALLSSLVDSTRDLARPPISNFRVGAVALGGSTGRVFRGVNLEFPGLPLHHSVHAEQFLVANMAQNGERSVSHIAVSAAPCGHCRQFLQELRGAPDIQILIVDHPGGENAPAQELSRFLPHRFGPDDLLAQDLDFPLLLEPRRNGFSLLHEDRNGFLENSPHFRVFPGSEPGSQQMPSSGNLGELRRAALEAANGSYAPYSRCPSGVALLARGGIFAGSYCESAAYNPSLPPLQAAIVAFVANGGGGYEEIELAMLVERNKAPVQQAATTRMVLDQISPRCPLYVFYMDSTPTPSSS